MSEKTYNGWTNYIAEFESEVAVREQTGPTGKALGRFEWKDGCGAWHVGFSSRRDAVINAAHDMLYRAQKYGCEESYTRLLAIVWTMPLPSAWALKWDSDFRPRYDVMPIQRIPVPWKAPKQAAKWGMAPELIATAKARHEAAEAIDSLAARTFALTNPYSLMYGQGIPNYTRLENFAERACAILRRVGLDDLLGGRRPAADAEAPTGGHHD